MIFAGFIRNSGACSPEPIAPEVAVPPWPKFLRGCAAFRASLDKELPNAAIADVEDAAIADEEAGGE